MEFSPSNHVVRLCIQAMSVESNGEPAEAKALFMQAWNEAANELERLIAAYHLAHRQETARDRLHWLESALEFAKEIDDPGVEAAFGPLYSSIAQCYEELGEPERAGEMYELADRSPKVPSDSGPFFHGTRADLQPGDMLTPGGESNYQDGLVMNHIYFTAIANGAGLAASLAKGDGRERVYMVEPTGSFEDDPNVTNQKFPGNLTRSYRSRSPLRIMGEVDDWRRQTPDQLNQWRERLASSQGKIIN